MNIGTLLSGAGRVSTGVRQREDELRRARLDQLVVEEANRANRARQEKSQVPLPQTGDFSGASEELPVLPGLKPPAPAAAPAPAAPAGVKVGKPAPLPTGTVGYQTAMENIQPGQLTRDRFLALPKAEQQRIYEQYRQELYQYNRQARGPRDEFGVQIPTGLPQRKVAATLDEYIQSLPQQYSGPSNARGRPKAGVKTGSEAPVQMAQGASQYDKPTEYDALIQQAAVQNGLDPVVFKRLLGTESSFNPNAVSPRGKSFGLGIGQIADSWGLSDAQRLDPTVAIPAAAQIFAQYVSKADGDYREAMMKYKGASSEKGRASMAPVIDGILSGIGIGTAQAEEVPQLAATGPALQQAVAAGGAAPRQTSPTQFYLANPEAVGYDMQLAQQQRAELVRLASIYQRAGMGDQYMDLRNQIIALDANLLNLAGIQGVQELDSFNTPNRLAKVWSIKTGQQINFQPREDGTFRVLVNGKVASEAATRAEIMDTALSMFDQSYRERKGARSDKEHEAALKVRELMMGKTADMIKDIYVAQQKGILDQQLEIIKSTYATDIKPLGDGTVIIRQPNGIFHFDPAGGEIEIDGVKVPITGARRVTGLDIPAGR